MKNERLRLYTIEFFMIVFLLLALIFNNMFTKPIIAIVLLVFMIISVKLLKNDKLDFMNSRQITILLGATGIIYVAILYILGIFAGFYTAVIKFSLKTFLNYILPYIVIIISSETIRKRIILKGDKKSKIILLILMVILDVVLNININNLNTVNNYFTLIVFVIFSSIANNLLFNYIETNYRNEKAIIIYRLITILYLYIIPITPDIHIFFETIYKMVIPYIIYAILEAIYGKETKIIPTIQKRIEFIIGLILCVIVAIIIMLVSCKFKYGMLVIGSESMTGTINKGDIIIYKKYEDDEEIKEGQIIVFKYENKRIVHRIADSRNLNYEEIRYYTKGDANLQEDLGYRIKDDIIRTS